MGPTHLGRTVLLVGTVACAGPTVNLEGHLAAGADAPASTDASASRPTEVTPKFEATRAWTEFVGMLHADYAYLERADFDVPVQLEHARRLALQTRSAAEFRDVVRRLSYAFTDPHFLVGPLAETDPNVFPTSADLVVELRGDSYAIADVRAESAADAAAVRPGWELVGVNGLTIDAAIAALWGGVVVAKTPKQTAYAATVVVNGARTGTRSLEFAVGGRSRTVELANPREFASAVRERPLLTVRRVGSIAIVRVENSLGARETIDAFDAVVAELADSSGLILDLRNTPSGGNTDVARAIIGHFISETRAYQVHEIPAVQRETSVPRRFIEQVLPRTPHYTGRVAVVGGHWTGSMGEGLVIGMHAAAGARTFASDMGDLLGGLANIDLEHSGARIDLGVEALFHVDGTPRAQYVADVPLASGDRNADGSDPALPAALAWLRRR